MNGITKTSTVKVAAPAGSTALLQVLWIVLCAGATALSSRVEIPHAPVPFTLQTLVVLLAGAFLGARNGALSQCLYLAAGFAGAPVFAGGAFGFARLIGPTGGYLVAFPLAAAAVGYLVTRGRSLPWTTVSMASGLIIIFGLGTLHLAAFTTHGVSSAVNAGFLIFSWWDMLKLAAAAMIYQEVGKRWPRLPA